MQKCRMDVTPLLVFSIEIAKVMNKVETAMLNGGKKLSFGCRAPKWPLTVARYLLYH